MVRLLTLSLAGLCFAAKTGAEESVESIAVDLHGGTTMEFVWIPPGSFLMGSAVSAPERGKDETPAHEVVISRGFYLGKYEITQSQWVAIMGTAPWTGKKHVERHPDHPAAYISWTSVQEFLRRVNDAAGEQLYRLPTEAEWEYACRAGTTARRFFGENEHRLGDYAWFIENGPKAGLGYAQPVGEKLPNPWGLHDIYGNVWEWVQDWYSPTTPLPARSTRPVLPPAPPGSCAAAVSSTTPRNVRSAKRYSHDPSLRFSAIGARLVRTRK